MKDAVGILILFVPLVVELINDAKGDYNKRIDVVIRLLNAVAVGIIAHFITDRNTLTGINLSFAIHFLFFDYIISYILINNGVLEPPRGVTYHWWTYQAKRGVIDNLKFWKSIGPYGRLFVKLGYFLISLYLYLTI